MNKNWTNDQICFILFKPKLWIGLPKSLTFDFCSENWNKFLVCQRFSASNSVWDSFLPLLYGKAIVLHWRHARSCHSIIAVKVAENCLGKLVYVKDQSLCVKWLKFCADTVRCVSINSCVWLWFVCRLFSSISCCCFFVSLVGWLVLCVCV